MATKQCCHSTALPRTSAKVSPDFSRLVNVLQRAKEGVWGYL